MANEEHLAILKKDVVEWNRWREKNPTTKPDLSEADLSGWNISYSRLQDGNLRGARFAGADLRRSNLTRADLQGADLADARLAGADLIGANLANAGLMGADFWEADLTAADLSHAYLLFTDFRKAGLAKANLKGAWMAYTLLDEVNLSGVRNLELVEHHGPSTIGISTIYWSKGRIPERFLRGAGVPESFITYMKSLVVEPIEFYSCFVSYSSKDQEFAERLYADLQQKHVRCWFAPEDMKIGDRIQPRIDEAIRVHDKLLLVLTESSMKSAWVEKEVETAFEKERKQGRTVLFPIRLDDAVMEADEAWAADIRRTRHIGDFCGWKEHDQYKKAFERLMRDLKAET